MSCYGHAEWKDYGGTRDVRHRKSGGDRSARRSALDEQLADQLLGQAAAEGAGVGPGFPGGGMPVPLCLRSRLRIYGTANGSRCVACIPPWSPHGWSATRRAEVKAPVTAGSQDQRSSLLFTSRPPIRC